MRFLKWFAGITFGILALVIILIIVAGGSEEANPTSPIIVEDNLSAAKLQAGMIFDTDFSMDNSYMDSFVKTVMLDSFVFDGTTVRYKQTMNLTEFFPYFAWVCYPQITRGSQATIIFLEDVGGDVHEAGDFTVRAVLRVDTSDALEEFGGTYGTKQRGW